MESQENPYQPPQPSIPPPTAAPAGERPTAVTVFGILNIIFAGFALLSAPLSLLMLSMPQPANAPANPAMDLMKSPGYRNATLAVSAVSLIATVVQLAGGIALLKMKDWGRRASNGVAVFQIVASFVVLGINYVFLFGPLLKLIQEANDPATQGGAIGGLIGGAAPCFGPIYPVLMLIFLNRPAVKRALQRPPIGELA